MKARFNGIGAAVEDNGRILGIDLIRIVSMLMILILHICLQGGVLENLAVGSAAYWVAWLLESLCYCSVNCYAVITGYVMYSPGKKDFKYSRIIPLWLQVFLWNGLITLLFAVFSPETVTTENAAAVFMPALNGQYWYFTAYFGMFFFIPFFNILIDNIDKKGFICLIVTLFAIFSFLPFTFAGKIDPFNTAFGYSTLWLSVLYFAGAFIKRMENEIRVKKGIWAVIYVLSSVIPCISSVLLDVATVSSVEEDVLPNLGGGTYAYNSPFTVAAAVSLFILLKDIKTTNRFVTAAVRASASVSFGIYLIHVNPLVFENIFKDMFKDLASMPCFIMIISIIAYAVLLYAVLGAADYVRLLIFRLLKTNERSERLVTGLVNKLKTMKVK